VTILRPTVHHKTGKVGRVYVKRPGLHAKLWLEESRYHSGMCEVRFDGNAADFSETSNAGEAAHIAEARMALADLGLDMTRCTWDDIVVRATAPVSHARSLRRFISRFLGRG
jgi:hypothetical protein